MLKYLTSKATLPSNFGYTELEPVQLPFGQLQCFTWHNGYGKNERDPVTIFKLLYKNKDNEFVPRYKIEMAKKHLRSIKLVRHPGILRVLDTRETDNGIWIVTERCYPFTMDSLSTDPTLGINQIFTALSFLHDKCNLIYSQISPTGICVRTDGSWCLFVFELVNDCKISYHTLVSELKSHILWRNGWRPHIPNSTMVQSYYVDYWGLGTLMCWIYTLLSGNIDKCNTSHHGVNIGSLKVHVPDIAHDLIDKLVNTMTKLDLDSLSKNHPYFKNNTCVMALSYLSELHIRSEDELKHFFIQLPSYIKQMPFDISCKQLLPEILKAMALYKSLVPRILDSVILICKSILVDDFRVRVYPCILGLFRDSDRSIRYSLLCQMSELDALLDERQVSEDIFEYLLIGFNDISAEIRDVTIKSLCYVIKKIKKRQQYVAVMALLKCIDDPEPTIRTNSIICFAKIIPTIDIELVNKILPQVWSTGLNDTFVKSKIASIEAISASHSFFSVEDRVRILLPLLLGTLLDSDRQVQRQGFETILKILNSLRSTLTDETVDADINW